MLEQYIKKIKTVQIGKKLKTVQIGKKIKTVQIGVVKKVKVKAEAAANKKAKLIDRVKTGVNRKVVTAARTLRPACRNITTSSVKITSGCKALLPLVVPVLVGAAMLGTGFYLGERVAFTRLAPGSEARVETFEALQAWVNEEQSKVEMARREIDDQFDALAMRLASLQAQMMRVDAVGERMVKMAELDSTEFDFSTLPAVGGPEDPDSTIGVERTQTASALIMGMESLDKLLHHRDEQLSVLEEWLMTNEVRRQTTPNGLPVLDGWVSSGYGTRINPVTGKYQRHSGVDIPGARGEDVIAVAAGLVTKSKRISGYGNVVQILHANGYSTRYAHNQANLVAEGDRVEKGQVIALLGSTGRSTGPHVHFEVRKDGEAINPAKFISDEG